MILCVASVSLLSTRAALIWLYPGLDCYFFIVDTRIVLLIKRAARCRVFPPTGRKKKISCLTSASTMCCNTVIKTVIAWWCYCCRDDVKYKINLAVLTGWCCSVLQCMQSCVRSTCWWSLLSHRQSGPTEDYRFIMTPGKVSISKICHITFTPSLPLGFYSAN